MGITDLDVILYKSSSSESKSDSAHIVCLTLDLKKRLSSSEWDADILTGQIVDTKGILSALVDNFVPYAQFCQTLRTYSYWMKHVPLSSHSKH